MISTVIASEKFYTTNVDDFWNEKVARAIMLEVGVTFGIYVALYIIDLALKKNWLIQRDSETPTKPSNDVEESQLSQNNQVNQQTTQRQKKSEKDSQTESDRSIDDQKKNFGTYTYEIVIMHALTAGLILTSGFQKISEMVLCWVHLGYFLLYIAFNILMGPNPVLKYTFWPFYLINVAMIIIALVKI